MLAFRVALCFLIVSNSSFAHGKVIALGNQKEIKSFKEFIIQNPSYTSLNQFILTRKLEKNNSLLENKYRLAIKGLALEDLKPSIFLFQEITNFPNESLIFSDEKNKLVSESYFRLSNLDRSNTDFWISKAIHFDPAYSPSDETFNPQIIKKFNSESKKIAAYFYKLKTNNFKPQFSRAFVNGQEVKDKISVHPSAKYNLQIYKEGSIAINTSISGEELINLKNIQLEKLALGTCKNPKFFEPKNKITVDAVYYSKNCIKLKKDQILLAENAPNIDFNKSSFDSSKTKLRKSSAKKKSIFSKKKTWYYIIGGALLSGLALSLSDSGGSKVRPVQHD